MRTRVRVSRETVWFLAGCHLSRLGSIGLMPARSTLPTPIARGGIDVAALDRRAGVVLELRLRVMWSNRSEATDGRLRI